MGISKPSTAIFWISLVLGLYAVINEFVYRLPIPVLSSVSNMILLTIAFVLLMLGVIFKNL